jgi:hypothetical protein
MALPVLVALSKRPTDISRPADYSCLVAQH